MSQRRSNVLGSSSLSLSRSTISALSRQNLDVQSSRSCRYSKVSFQFPLLPASFPLFSSTICCSVFLLFFFGLVFSVLSGVITLLHGSLFSLLFPLSWCTACSLTHSSRRWLVTSRGCGWCQRSSSLGRPDEQRDAGEATKNIWGNPQSTEDHRMHGRLYSDSCSFPQDADADGGGGLDMDEFRQAMYKTMEGKPGPMVWILLYL